MNKAASVAMWLALTFAIIGIAALILFPDLRLVFEQADANRPAPPPIVR